MNHYKNSSLKQSSCETVDNISAQLSWWVKITTTKPFCIYYFGSFDCQNEAKVAQYGYVEDLVEERAQGIRIEIIQDQPQALTITPREGV